MKVRREQGRESVTCCTSSKSSLMRHLPHQHRDLKPWPPGTCAYQGDTWLASHELRELAEVHWRVGSEPGVVWLRLWLGPWSQVNHRPRESSVGAQRLEAQMGKAMDKQDVQPFCSGLQLIEHRAAYRLLRTMHLYMSIIGAIIVTAALLPSEGTWQTAWVSINQCWTQGENGWADSLACQTTREKNHQMRPIWNWN